MIRMFSMVAALMAGMGQAFHVPRMVSQQPMRRGKTKNRSHAAGGSSIKGIKSTNMTAYGATLKSHFESSIAGIRRREYYKRAP